jgi:hypothetical protein
VTTRAITLAALLATFGRPSWWLLALAGFLVRGGVLLFVLATVTLPSPLVISNIVAPLVVPLALGQLDGPTLTLIGVALATIVTWLVGGACVAAVTEVALIRDGREAMMDEGLAVPVAIPPRRWLRIRVATAHLLAHVPTAFVLAIGSVRIAGVAYVELTNPFEVTTPLILRVIVGAASPIAAIVLGGGTVLGSLRGAVGDIVRRPLGALVPALGTTMILAIDLAALLGAVAIAWTQVGDRLTDSRADGSALMIGLLAFGASWIGALALTGLIDAWRGAAMTFEFERAALATASSADRAPDQGGTIGVPPGRRPGDWSTGEGGGSL